MNAFGITDIGLKRSINQDAFCVEPCLGLLAVADGLGGRAGGETASRLAISVLTHHLRTHLPSVAKAPFLDLLEGAVQAGNAAIQERGDREPQCQGMGTTLTACLVNDGTAYLAHVGDSRAYLLRQNCITQLTEDHTLATLQRIRGRSGAEEARPMRSKKLLSALGISPWASFDLFAREVQAGDLLLLCTDGLTAEVADEELATLAQLRLPLADRCARLVALANERGGTDNITVVLAALEGGV